MTTTSPMKVYISGAVSLGGTLPPDRIEANRQVFFEAARLVEANGDVALNPAVLDEPTWGWSDYMRACIRMVTEADAILLLDGWEASSGAQLERRVASALGLREFTVGDLESTP